MNKIFILVILMCAFQACKKEKVATYNSADNVYFDFDAETTDRDSIIYTFAYTPGLLSDTIFLPVRLSGNRSASERTYGVTAVADRSTAIAGTHYEAFKNEYAIASDSGIHMLPVILLNTDPALADRSVTLVLQLTSAMLGTADTSLVTARIVFSNKLEKPIWWEMWLGTYYSQVKHELFLISSGATDLTLSGLDAPKNLYHVGRLTNFLNDPFSWISANPESGYTLEQRADGNYDFYNISNASKKILLRKNEDANKFYFIDENGAEII